MGSRSKRTSDSKTIGTTGASPDAADGAARRIDYQLSNLAMWNGLCSHFIMMSSQLRERSLDACQSDWISVRIGATRDIVVVTGWNTQCGSDAIRPWHQGQYRVISVHHLQHDPDEFARQLCGRSHRIQPRRRSRRT